MRVIISKLLLLTILLSSSSLLFSQQTDISKAYLQKEMSMVQFENDIPADQFFHIRAEAMGLTNETEMVFERESKGENSISYKKYTQYYKGIPVFGSAYTLHTKKKRVLRSSGYYLPKINLDIKPKIAKEQAVSIAIQEMRAEEYIWDSEVANNVSAYDENPDAELVIVDRAFPKSSEFYALAYQVDVHSAKPLDKKRFFIDANTGFILLDLPLLMQHAVPGRGICKYYGEQPITIDSLGSNQYVLRDPSRGEGNAVFDDNGNVLSHNSNFWDQFNLEEGYVAVDAHYCTEKFYDFMLNKFGWSGLDGNGKSMNSVVHIGELVNAYWDGDMAYFGDGSCHHGPLTTLEVVAHEFMHGITDYTSNLIYRDESGAINESMSDVFGIGLSYFTNPSEFEWTIGGSFIESPYVTPFRSFINPNQFEHPKMYKGKFWEDGGGVHTNSSVGNHWFYLLVNGAKGVNENGYEYDVKGIGMEDALQLVFQVQSGILFPNSTYSFYARSSVSIARDLFGANASQVASVEEAWKAVGLPFDNPIADFLDLQIEVIDAYVSTCIDEGYFPIEFVIKNEGTIPYNPNMQATLSLRILGAQEERIINLDETIPSGGVTMNIVDDYLFLDSDSSVVIIFDLRFSNNNSLEYRFASIDIENNANGRENLGIFEIEESSNYQQCLVEEVEVAFYVFNESCSPVAAGTEFDINYYGENSLLLNKSYTLPFALEGQVFYEISQIFDVNEIDSRFIQVELDYSEDSSYENNFLFRDLDDTEIVDDEFIQTFDGERFNNIAINGWSPSTPSLSYEGENYFASTGNYFGNSIFSLCPNAEDQIKPSLTSLNLCVDTRNFEKPVLNFDMIQFRNDIDIPLELQDNTSFLKIIWTDGENDFEDLIIGQEEGDLIRHFYALPDKVQGHLELVFFNASGDIGLLNQDDFDPSSIDLILLDNLAILDQTTEAGDSDILQFSLFPNPTQDNINVDFGFLPLEIIVRNMQGLEVGSYRPTKSPFEISTHNLPAGAYSISLIFEDQVQSKLFSKID